MALRKIATVGHPVLRAAARPVSREELATPSMQSLLDDLVDTMRDAAGAGLAAPQVHEGVRLCVVEVKDNPRYPYKPNVPLTILVNPVVTPTTTETWDVYEGCLSVPNLRGEVRRFTEVHVTAWDRHGHDVAFDAKGLTAGTFQHEVDHLDGVLFLDRVTDSRTLSTWADFERFHKAAFVARAKAIVARFGQ